MFDGSGDRLVEVAADAARLGPRAPARLPGRSPVDDERPGPAVGAVRHVRVHRGPAPHALGVPDVRDALRGGLRRHSTVVRHHGVVGDRGEPTRPGVSGGSRDSGGVRRRAGIELKRVVDVDADAAVSMVGKYKQQVLRSV